MAAATHTDVIAKAIELIKELDLKAYGIRPEDVVERDFPFNGKPPVGIVVSRVKEDESGGLNNSRDIVYPVQVMRCGHSLDNKGGNRRSAWREAIWSRFNYVRIGVDSELKTQCRHMEIELDSRWQTWNLDASVLRIETYVRKTL